LYFNKYIISVTNRYRLVALLIEPRKKAKNKNIKNIYRKYRTLEKKHKPRIPLLHIYNLGDRVYADEQSEFRCNTQQPGCVQVIFRPTYIPENIIYIKYLYFIRSFDKSNMYKICFWCLLWWSFVLIRILHEHVQNANTACFIQFWSLFLECFFLFGIFLADIFPLFFVYTRKLCRKFPRQL